VGEALRCCSSSRSQIIHHAGTWEILMDLLPY
jgi:hypothetical protein